MPGLFGYFSSTPHREMIVDLAKSVGYSINEVKASRSSLVCRLDLKSEEDNKPIINSEREGYCVFCGETYNEDVRDPLKYILELYRKGELEKIGKLNGSFLAAIYDNATDKLILINDRFASMRLFYYYENGELFFSPKISALLKIKKGKKIRKDALFDFLTFGYLLGDKTFDEGIFLLPPASILEVSKNEMKRIAYWTYPCDGTYDLREKEVLLDELEALWQTAVDRRVKNNEKIIIQISGGLDSRAILAAALKSTSKENIVLCTFGDNRSYDINLAVNVGKIISNRHILLNPIKENFAGQYAKSFQDTEGMIDATPYFAINMDDSLKQVSNKMYNGFMGGEIMGPLIFPKIKHLNFHDKTQYDKAKRILLNHHKQNDIQTIQHLFNPGYLNGSDVLASFEQSVKDIDQVSINGFPNYCARWLYTNESFKYTSFCNFRYDNTFRLYKPFLDYDLLDFMLHVPPELRMNKKLYKEMLIKNYPQLFNLNIKNSYGLLNLQASNIPLLVDKICSYIKTKLNIISNHIILRNFFYNKDQNYLDYNDLLRTNKEYQTFMKTMIDKVKTREFFNAEYIDRLWEMQLTGKRNCAMIFGLLVTFEMFLETFYDPVQK